MIKIRFYGNLQSVVDGAPNRHEHLVLAEIGVNAGEGAGRTWETGVEYGSRIQSVPSIVGNGGPGRYRAVDGGSVETGTASDETAVCCRDRCLRVSRVQGARGAYVIGVDSQQVVLCNF